jgi:glycosyltransferase involved in cell wall biosynthesis
MKVLQVLNHFLPEKTAGTEIYALTLSFNLNKKGINTKVLIPNYNKIINEEYKYNELSVIKFAEPSEVDRSLIMGFRKPDGLEYFKNILIQEKPDIIHFHELAGSNGITLSHVEAARSHGSKVVFTFHLAGYSCKNGTLINDGDQLCDGKINYNKCAQCYLNDRGYNRFSKILVFSSEVLHKLSIDPSKWNSKYGTAFGIINIFEKLQNDLIKLIDNCDRVVVISEWYKKILNINGIERNKIIFIPQGLSSSQTLPSRNVFSKGKVKLLFIGRISKFKGLHILIDAVIKINKDLVELSIFGNTDEIDYERDLKNVTKNHNNIFWNGLLKKENVLEIMGHHDILCLCSTFSEMSPLVIQEAFAMGLPVIASNVYGNAEQIIHDKNGLLFRFNDASDLKYQIERCIHESTLLDQMSKNIMPPRSFEDVTEEYIELYNSLLN